ncbi:MAG TPA: serine/threonine-protein kinase [Polyangia bacterium]|nr:serine/threonine-protein kinase [Polyangia bacterium]
MTDAQDTHEASAASGRVGLVGKTLGRYRISAELGRGGMATVYRAFDPQLARDVAIKVMHGAFTGRGDIERRFRREAQAVAALKHECVVDVFDFAPGGDGEPAYIVSELVEGPTLRQLLDRAGGRLVPELAVVVAARVAAALGAAHARGIVHRDVKPDNVMIDVRPGGARVLLTDFGIARMTEDDTMTATGSILGSPSYMSPEQAKSGTIGPASDVFSLGATLYQMVVGRPPFAGKDPFAVIAALVSGDFLRPAQVDARVGPELEGVILRCLERLPAERYADGAAVAAALREIAAASAGVLGEEGAALRAFHADQRAFERRIGGPIADAAVERARACMRRAELTKALAQINRALAYAPNHRGAEALLAQLSSRRRWARGAAVAAALLLVTGGVAGVRARRHATGPARARATALDVGVARAPVAPPIATVIQPPARQVVAPAPPKSAAPAVAKSERVKRERGRHAPSPTPANAPTTVTSQVVPEAAATPPLAPPAAEPTPPARPQPAPTAGITLRAWQGFCSPSLDERPAALRPIYEGVSAGTHQISCTMPGGQRVRVGTFELRASTHPDVIILRGADGAPILGRPQ